MLLRMSRRILVTLVVLAPTIVGCVLMALVHGATVFDFAPLWSDEIYYWHQTETFRTAGFSEIKIWPGWEYSTSIPGWGFPGKIGTPWRVFNRFSLKFSDSTYTRLFNIARKFTGKEPKDLLQEVLLTIS